jgi:hypothetical protein
VVIGAMAVAFWAADLAYMRGVEGLPRLKVITAAFLFPSLLLGAMLFMVYRPFLGIVLLIAGAAALLYTATWDAGSTGDPLPPREKKK